jgi:hypothetical protein
LQLLVLKIVLPAATISGVTFGGSAGLAAAGLGAADAPPPGRLHATTMSDAAENNPRRIGATASLCIDFDS